MDDSVHGERKRKGSLVLPCLALLASGAAVVIPALRTPRLDEVARRVADGIEACDGATLMRYSHPEEARALRLTPAKLDRLCRLLGDPPAHVARAGSDLLHPTFGGSAQHIVRSFRTTAGVAYSMSVSVHPTDAGARAFVVLPTVAARFEALYADRFREEPESTRTWLAIEAGLRDYASDFERLGIPGAMDESLQVIRWDELRALATQAVSARRTRMGETIGAAGGAPPRKGTDAPG